MTSNEDAVKRLQESKPPATDSFTYLTIIEQSLSPEVLPALHQVLQDERLTSDIGWDLVEMLVAVPGGEPCLETIARLGNPREVILKVLEVMEKTTGAVAGGDDAEDDVVEMEDQKVFVTLCGMLGILHTRLQVKLPSRFLHTTLQAVYGAYDATNAESTAAVIDLVRSLSGNKRPALPMRKSSTRLETPFRESDPNRAAPDPEAEGSEASEPERTRQLLQSFVTCIFEAYVNSNALEWAARLLEYEVPERVVLRRQTTMQAFKEVPELQARDALVGQLAVSRRRQKLPIRVPCWVALCVTQPNKHLN